MTDLTNSFLAEIEAFLVEADMPATTFGRAAMNDQMFVKRLHAGSTALTNTVDRVRAYMAHERAARRAAR